MSQGLAYRKLGLGRSGAAAKTRQASLRSGSAIALCRALLCRALPGVFVGIGFFAVPENPLGAMAGSRGAGSAHVRVAIEEIAPATVRANVPRAMASGTGQRDTPSSPVSQVGTQRLATEMGLAGALIEPAGSLSHGIDGHALDAAGVETASGAALVQQAAVSVPAASAIDCQDSASGDECEWSAAAGIVAPAESAIEGGFGLSDFGTSGDAARLEPRIGYIPFSLDTGFGPLVTWSGSPPPANSLAPTHDLVLSISHEVESSSDVGAAQQSGPANEKPFPFVPERVVTIPGTAMRSRNLDEGVQSSGSSPAMSVSGALEQVPSGVAQDALAVMKHGRVLASEQVSRAQQQWFLAPVVSPWKASGIKNAALGAGMAAVAVAGARDVLVFALTGQAPLVTSAEFSAPRLVRLRSLIEALHERFEGQELQRLTASSAADAYLPVDRLRLAGIPVGGDLAGNDLPSERVMAGRVASQPAVLPFFAARDDDTPTGGLRGLGLDQSLSASASAGFDSNPFLAQGGNPEAASLRFQLAPALSRKGERSSFRLTGRLEHIEYLGQYASLQNFGADLAASRKLTERMEFEGGLTFRSDVLATNLGNPFGNDELGSGSPVPPTGNDVTLLGQGQRRTQYGLDGGLTFDLSQRDQLRWSVSARADRFGSAALVDSNFVSQRLQYSRRLGEDVTIGAAVDANIIDFTGSGLEGAQTVSPQLQVNAALTPRLTLTASVGLAVTRLEFGGLEDTTTALAGDVALCRKGERSSFCINASRQVLPAAIGGALLQTSGGLSYSLQLSERDTVQISGSYATASQPIAATVGDFESINGSVRYERRLNERMRIFASGGVLNTAGNLPTNVTNIQGLIGITMNFGQTR